MAFVGVRSRETRLRRWTPVSVPANRSGDSRSRLLPSQFERPLPIACTFFRKHQRIVKTRALPCLSSGVAGRAVSKVRRRIPKFHDPHEFLARTSQNADFSGLSRPFCSLCMNARQRFPPFFGGKRIRLFCKVGINQCIIPLFCKLVKFSFDIFQGSLTKLQSLANVPAPEHALWQCPFLGNSSIG